jgi:hypothetical protein
LTKFVHQLGSVEPFHGAESVKDARARLTRSHVVRVLRRDRATPALRFVRARVCQRTACAIGTLPDEAGRSLDA